MINLKYYMYEYMYVCICMYEYTHTNNFLLGISIFYCVYIGFVNPAVIIHIFTL